MSAEEVDQEVVLIEAESEGYRQRGENCPEEEAAEAPQGHKLQPQERSFIALL